MGWNRHWVVAVRGAADLDTPLAQQQSTGKVQFSNNFGLELDPQPFPDFSK